MREQLTPTMATEATGPPSAEGAMTMTTAQSERVDLRRARAVATRAAEAAGALLRRQARQAFSIRSKDEQGDLVTDLDLASEAMIISHLRAAFPEHRIITEEAGELVGKASWTWLVDPLDGTNNLAIGLTAYGIGLALCQGGLPRVAVVHDVPSATTWSAMRGHGAYGPDGRLPRRSPTKSGSMTIAWIQGHQVPRDDLEAAAIVCRLERASKRVLQLWAPLLCWVMLARADIDGIVLYQAGSVDLQAGTLIAQEAGLHLHEFDGEPFDDRFSSVDEHRSLVAGSPEIVERLLALVQAAGPAGGSSGMVSGSRRPSQVSRGRATAATPAETTISGGRGWLL
jgi:myo-inositol-1(or 4)-monophosphatase